MNNKLAKILIISGIIITTICAMIGFSYAYLRLQVIGNDNASSIITNLGALELTFSDGQYINNTNINVGWTQSKTITITNTGTETVSYYLIWETLTNTFVNKSLLTYSITNAGAGASLSQTPIPFSGENLPIFPQTSIAAGVVHTYTITFNYENSSTIDQSSDMNQIFTGKLKVVEEIPLWSDSCTAGSDALNCSILADNPEYITQIVTNDTMFESAATTDQGLWIENRAGKTEDNLPVYFYRGDIDNNYVSFAGKMWRIVRINENGSVKLILGGNSATDGYGGTTAFNLGYRGGEYVDYNHANNALRVANEDWYTNNTKGNLDEYESYIADTKFCNDKSVISTSGSDIYYGAYGRINTNKSPQYKCLNLSDNYIYKIGALTADEVAYTGGVSASSNTLYYLYDNAQINSLSGYWWLLTPYYFEGNTASVYRVQNDGNLGYRNVSILYGFRPVISLKSDTLKLRGEGTIINPYVITE